MILKRFNPITLLVFKIVLYGSGAFDTDAMMSIRFI